MVMVTRAVRPEDIARLGAGVASPVPKMPAAVVKFVGGMDGRELTVPLAYPVEVDGELVAVVKIRRPVMREWRAYLRACADAVRINGANADDLVDQPWVSISAATLEELDAIDASRVESAMESFFEPSASMGAAESESSTPTTGEESPST